MSRRRRVKGFYTDEQGKVRPLTEYFEKSEESPRDPTTVKAKLLGDASKLLNTILVENANCKIYFHNDGATLYATKSGGKTYELVYHKIGGQWKLVKIDTLFPEYDTEMAKLGGRMLVNKVKAENERGEEIEVPIYVRNEIIFERADPITLKFYKSLPIDRTAESWAYAPNNEIISRLKVRKENFKYGSIPLRVKSLELAEKIAHELAKSHGGAEIVQLDDKTFVVKSRGYYHYIGA